MAKFVHQRPKEILAIAYSRALGEIRADDQYRACNRYERSVGIAPYHWPAQRYDSWRHVVKSHLYRLIALLCARGNNASVGQPQVGAVHIVPHLSRRTDLAHQSRNQ